MIWELSVPDRREVNAEAELIAEANRLIASNDPAERQAGYCLRTSLGLINDWLSDIDEEIPSPAPVNRYPSLPGLELKNSEDAERLGYLLYVGSREACVAGAEEFAEAHPRRNGRTGSWKLVVPLRAIERNQSRLYAQQRVCQHVETLAEQAGLDRTALAARLRAGIGVDRVDQLMPGEIKYVLLDLRYLANNNAVAA
jgi:hypothetical protein